MMENRYFNLSVLAKDGTTHGTYTIPNSPALENVIPDLDGLEVGWAVKIEAIEMTQEQFESLPEFEGF